MLENQEIPENIHLLILEPTDLVLPAVAQKDHPIVQEHPQAQDLPVRFQGHQEVVVVVHQEPLDPGVRVVPVQEQRKNRYNIS